MISEATRDDSTLDFIVVWKLNRFSMSLEETIELRDKLKRVDTKPGLHHGERDRRLTVASGIRDAKAESTRRAYASAWRRFQKPADAGGHLILPTIPMSWPSTWTTWQRPAGPWPASS